MNLENIKKDYYFNKLYIEHGYDYIKKAGYFESDDNSFTSLSDEEIEDTLYMTSTPIPSIDKLKIENAVILLITGSFNPIHDDHIDMMYYAELSLIFKDYYVAGCYFAPDHDEYVQLKSPNNNLNISERTENIYKKIKNTKKNYFIDDWAGLYLNKSVNFTTIYRRLELYIKKHTGLDIPIFFVCGSDRGEFSYTFKEKTVVVRRLDNNFKEIKTDIHPYSIYSHQAKGYMSSSVIRAYKKLERSKKKNLHLRIVDNNGNTYERFKLFNEQFSSVDTSTLQKNKDAYNALTHNKNIISLDKELPSKYNLSVSRYYMLGGVNFIDIDSSPRSRSLKSQIKKIIKNYSYYLFEDDICGGITIKKIKELLKNNGITINGTFTLINSDPENCEVLDLNDFYLKTGYGLCVLTPDNKKIRFPYLFPFVNITRRCSIYNDPIKFSKKMWELIYHETPENDIISSSLKYEFLEYVGFDKNSNVREIIKKIIKDLS